MKKSDLFLLIQSFSPVEVREVRKFLSSPFFNQRDDLVHLFEYLLENENPTKVGATLAVARGSGGTDRYGSGGKGDHSPVEKGDRKGRPYEGGDDQALRLLMSYLLRLLEEYLTLKNRSADKLENRLHLLLAYQERGMTEAFERNAKRLEKELEKQPLRDAHFHRIRQRMQWERYQVDTALNPTDTAPIRRLAESIDLTYLSNRLRVICMGIAQTGVYSADYQSEMENKIIQLAEAPKWEDVPAIGFYLSCFRMLRQPESVAFFQKFKSLLLTAEGQFSEEEMLELFTHALNFCIRRINRGEREFSKEAFELYKSALESGYLLRGKELDRFTYHNIVAAGLQTGELDWVENFIHEHKKSIARRYRESSFSFNLAKLEYTRKNHDSVLELLQKANYRDPLLNLAAKTLLLKTYFDLDEYDLLQSHLDAMRNYIRRKRVIGYHRTNYLNIIKFTERLLRLNFLDKKEVEKMRQSIENEEITTEREWLMGRLK